MEKLIKYLEKLTEDPRIKSAKITGWQSFGDDGPSPLPIIKITKFTKNQMPIPHYEP